MEISQGEDVSRGRYQKGICHKGNMFQGEAVTKGGCLNCKMSHVEDVTSGRCHKEYVTRERCHKRKMSQGKDVTRGGSHKGKMSQGKYVLMTRCLMGIM